MIMIKRLFFGICFESILTKHRRNALTLVEMLLAMAITGVLIAGVVTLAKVAEDTFQTANTAIEDVQVWKTVTRRIDRAIRRCYANEQFPGAIVVSRTAEGFTFPETLVVWTPINGKPIDPAGRPRLKELVFFMPAGQAANELREYTLPDSQALAPALEDVTGWRSLVAQIRTNSALPSILLTNRLRYFSFGSEKLGAIRFYLEMAPSIEEWKSSSLSWEDLSWPQGLFAPDRGQRRVRIRVEIQLAPSPSTTEFEAPYCRTFIGSLSFYYSLRKDARVIQ